jgi:hypothetical protein
MPISFSDLQFAFEFASFGALGENRAILDTQSGRLYYHSEIGDNMEEDEFPDDIDDEKYIEIPHRNELRLGKPLVLEFAREVLPDDYDEVRAIFSRKGAYGRFKALLVRRRALDRWHDFSAKAEEAALRQWCADNAIELVD